MTDERLKLFIQAGLSIAVLVLSGAVLVVHGEIPEWLAFIDGGIFLWWFPSPVQTNGTGLLPDKISQNHKDPL